VEAPGPPGARYGPQCGLDLSREGNTSLTRSRT